MASYRSVATVWFQHRRQHTYSSSLASSIGSQQTEDLTPMNGEGNAVNSLVIVEALMKVLRYQEFLRHDPTP